MCQNYKRFSRIKGVPGPQVKSGEEKNIEKTAFSFQCLADLIKEQKKKKNIYNMFTVVVLLDS